MVEIINSDYLGQIRLLLIEQEVLSQTLKRPFKDALHHTQRKNKGECN